MTVRALPAAFPADSPFHNALSSVKSLIAAGITDDIQDLYLIGGSPASPMGLYKLQLNLNLSNQTSKSNARNDGDFLFQYQSDLKLVKSSMTVRPPTGFISHPQHIQFPTRLFGTAAPQTHTSVFSSTIAPGDCATLPAGCTDAIPSIPAPLAHGLFYPPQNECFQGEAGMLPPLLVKIHGYVQH